MELRCDISHPQGFAIVEIRSKTVVLGPGHALLGTPLLEDFLSECQGGRSACRRKNVTSFEGWSAPSKREARKGGANAHSKRAEAGREGRQRTPEWISSGENENGPRAGGHEGKPRGSDSARNRCSKLFESGQSVPARELLPVVADGAHPIELDFLSLAPEKPEVLQSPKPDKRYRIESPRSAALMREQV